MEYVRTSITLPEGVYAYLKELVETAREEGVKVSMNQIINDALLYYMDYVNLEAEYIRGGVDGMGSCSEIPGTQG